MAGTIRTTIFLAALTALFCGAGFMLAGRGGMMIALLFAMAMNAIAFWNSDRLALAVNRARPLRPGEAPGLEALLASLARRAGLPVPRLYVIDQAQPNAFATGRSPEQAAVAVSTGLLSIMDRDQLAGVLAHELAHIRHRDTLLMTVTATIAGALSMLANVAFWFGGNRDNPFGFVGVLLTALLAPMAASLVQLAISRTREFEADRLGAAIAGSPEGLAEALLKLEAGARRATNPAAEAVPAMAHLYIVNPLHGGGLARLFATHPPIAERVRRLRALGGHAPAPAGARATGPWG